MLNPQFILVALSLASLINAVTIGSSADLTIGNADISPDGFTRSYVSLFISLNTALIIAITPVLSWQGERFLGLSFAVKRVIGSSSMLSTP
jgi:hypothetical protein